MAVGGVLSRELRAIITADSTRFSAALGGAGKSADTFAAKLRRGVGRAAPFAAIGLAAVALQARQGVKGVMEDEAALANLESTLKATGNAANITSDSFFKYANELQATTGTSAAAITQGAALLSTFDKVRDAGEGQNAIFTRATAAALDLSKKGFGSLDSANKMLGKALQDPVRGIGALSKAGVDFLPSQRDLIKSLVESGDVLGAQRIIMERVEGQVKGTAEAYGQTTQGKIDRAKRSFEELQKALALALLPAMAAIAEGISRVSGFLQRNEGAVKIAIIAFAGLAVAVLALKAAFAVAGAIALLANPIGLVVVAAAALAAGLIYLYKNSETARKVMDTVFKAIRAIVVPIINHIKGVIETFAALLRGDFRGAVEAVKGIVSNAFGAIPGLIGRVVSGAMSAAKRIGIAIWDGIKAGAAKLSELPGWLMGKIRSLISGLPSQALAAFRSVGGAIVDGIRAGVSAGWESLKSWVAGKIRSLPGGRLVLRALGQGANETGRQMAQEIQRGFERESTRMRNAIGGAVNAAILDARSNLASLASNLGGLASERIRAATRAGFGADPTAARSQYDTERAAREQLMIDRQRMELQEAARTARTRADRARAAQALADFEADQNLARLERLAREEEALVASRDQQAQQAGERAQQDVNNLVARFNQGAISADQFRTELDTLIGGPAGEELGAAFQLNFNTALNDVITQLGEFAREVSAVFGLAPGSVISPANIRAALTAEADEKAAEEAGADAKAASQRKHAAWSKRRAAFLKNLKAGKTRLKSIGAWEKANPEPVKLAAGGILRRPILAGEAGPEAVIPLTGSLGRNALARAMQDAGEAAGAGSPTVINLTVHGVMATDVRQFAARLRPELDRVITARY